MIPVFLIEIALSPLADTSPGQHQEYVSELLAACSSILEEGRCVSVAEPLGEDEAIQGRAELHWQSERLVHFSFTLEHSGQVFSRESLAFSALDPRREWFRALGFAVGTLASRAVETTSDGNEEREAPVEKAPPASAVARSEEGNEAEPGGSVAAFEVLGSGSEVPREEKQGPGGVEAPSAEALGAEPAADETSAADESSVPSLGDDSSAEDEGVTDGLESTEGVDEWWLRGDDEESKSRWAQPSWRTSLNLLAGPAFDDGSWRWGAELQQSFGWGTFPLYPVLGGYILSRPDRLTTTWFGLEVGAEFGFSPSSWPVGLYGQSLFLLETVRVEDDGSAQGAATFGAKVSVSVQWPRSGWWALRFNGGVNSLFNRTVVIMNVDESTPTRLTTRAFQPLLGAGFSVRFY